MRPWLERKVNLRRHTLKRAVEGLDWIANTNVLIRVALDGGWSGKNPPDLVSLAITDSAGTSSILRQILEEFGESERKRGTAESEIARRIRDGISSDDDSTDGDSADGDGSDDNAADDDD
jgi:hypothetical protein